MKAKIVGISIVVAIVAALITTIVFVDPIDVSPPSPKDEYEGWNRSGAFAINKFEYKVGENIFIVANNLKPDDIGNVVFVMPNGTTKYIVIPFDGMEKSGFNQYFKPSLSKNKKICDTNDLIGEWTAVFQGTNYKPIKFNILNETLQGEESIFSRIC
ncbi:hypothetical protein [Candidatus Nitrosotenuis cloacae]|uniref:hypothetical protein n=1 Tax=Candidatus Nitrosotenuis cloacae TaxID=1603555 RepID=UPI002280EC47|nr:hypothetical protein [Candidatus Nitrosotenuis cloacae]